MFAQWLVPVQSRPFNHRPGLSPAGTRLSSGAGAAGLKGPTPTSQGRGISRGSKNKINTAHLGSYLHKDWTVVHFLNLDTRPQWNRILDVVASAVTLTRQINAALARKMKWTYHGKSSSKSDAKIWKFEREKILTQSRVTWTSGNNSIRTNDWTAHDR